VLFAKKSNGCPTSFFTVSQVITRALQVLRSVLQELRAVLQVLQVLHPVLHVLQGITVIITAAAYRYYKE